MCVGPVQPTASARLHMATNRLQPPRDPRRMSDDYSDPASARRVAATLLPVQPLSGAAPLNVAITGPRLVLDRIAKCRFDPAPWLGRGGNGLIIDWGDG